MGALRACICLRFHCTLGVCGGSRASFWIELAVFGWGLVEFLGFGFLGVDFVSCVLFWGVLGWYGR